MATTTPRHNLKYIQQGQSQKEVTHAEALNLIDALSSTSLVYFQRNTPPTAPSEGNLYVVGSSPTGVWATKAGEVAQYIDAAWVYYTPFKGLVAYDSWGNQYWVYDGSTWQPDRHSAAAINVQTITGIANEMQFSDLYSIQRCDTSGGAMEVRLPGTYGLPTGAWIIFKKIVGDTNSVTIKAADNKLSNSSTLAGWTLNNTTVSADAIGGPERQSLSDKLLETTATGTHDASLTYSKASGVTQVNFAARLKAAERTYAILIVDDGTSTNRAQIRINLSNGALDFSSSAGTYVLDSYAIESQGDGWYLCKAYVTVPSASATVRNMIRLYDGANQNYTGVATSGIYAWGPHVSEGETVSTYLETSGTALSQTIDGDADYILLGLYEAVKFVFDGTNWMQFSA